MLSLLGVILLWFPPVSHQHLLSSLGFHIALSGHGPLGSSKLCRHSRLSLASLTLLKSSVRYLVACCLICIRQVFSRDKTDVIQNVIQGETDVEQEFHKGRSSFPVHHIRGIRHRCILLLMSCGGVCCITINTQVTFFLFYSINTLRKVLWNAANIILSLYMCVCVYIYILQIFVLKLSCTSTCNNYYSGVLVVIFYFLHPLSVY